MLRIMDKCLAVRRLKPDGRILNMRTFAHKQKPTQPTKSSNSARSGRAYSAQSREVRSILHLQCTIGNHAVQRLLQSNAEELHAESATPASTRFGHDFSRIPLFSPVPIQIQPKLAVSAPGDMYEQEADRVADQVMGISESELQSACACRDACQSHRPRRRESGPPPAVERVLHTRSNTPTTRMKAPAAV